MKMSEQGRALIRQYEGFSATPYICPAGKCTIGYGHVIRPGEDLRHVTETEAESLLTTDIAATEQAVSRLVTAQLNQPQFDALISFAYNIGTKAFEKSTLLRLLNDNSPLAGREFGRWVYANGRKLPGLVARRAAETALFNQTV